MPRVELARHLFRYFPDLEGRELVVEGATAAEVVRALDGLAPGLAGYLVDERGALRQHVNLFVAGTMVTDRRALSDRVPEGATVHVFQALSGG